MYLRRETQNHRMGVILKIAKITFLHLNVLKAISRVHRISILLIKLKIKKLSGNRDSGDEFLE